MHKRGWSKIFCTAASLSQLSVIRSSLVRVLVLVGLLQTRDKTKGPAMRGRVALNLVRIIVAWIVTS
jgi:hypothetical protein